MRSDAGCPEGASAAQIGPRIGCADPAMPMKALAGLGQRGQGRFA
jgi:hypothetical protein